MLTGDKFNCRAPGVTAIVDTTPPTILGAPPDAVVKSSQLGAVPVVTSSDNWPCHDGKATLTVQKIPWTDCTATKAEYLYKLVRAWSAKDRAGNTAEAKQTVTVLDGDAPVIARAPADASVQCDAVPRLAPLAASDNDPCFSASSTAAAAEVRENGACASNYTLTRTWTAVDTTGNKATAKQVLKVRGVLVADRAYGTMLHA